MAKRNGKENISYPDFLMLDFISIVISFVLSYRLKFGDFGFVSSENWMPLLYVVSYLNIIVCLFSDTYSGILKRPYYEEIIHAVLLTFYNLLAATVIFYVFKIGFVFSRQMILMMYGFYFFISLFVKCGWKKLILSKKIKAYNPKKISILVIGTKSNIDDVIQNATAGDFNAYDIKAVSLIDDTERTIADIPYYTLENNIEEVLIAVNPREISTDVYDSLIKNGIGVHFGIESVLGVQAEDYEIDSVGVNNTLSVGKYFFTQGQKIYILFKRIIDVFIGFTGLFLLVPVTAIIKIAYLISGDTSKILFCQTRVGIDGKSIRIFKYRTMVPNADNLLKELLKDEKYKAEWESNQKLNNDPRITKVGRFLRKTSIDELPQLVNVLTGEMSLVGPRPLVLGELEAHNGMKLYQMVKPGITGWWGCNGRSNISYSERLALEYYYVKNISFYLDFLCVLRTVLSIIKKDGAE